MAVFETNQIHRHGTIGKGGYSEVYKATLELKSRDCRSCVIKKFFEDRINSQNINQEISIWADLSHPNIVSLLGSYCEESSKLPLLVLELMDESYGHFLSYTKGHDPVYPTKLDVLRQVVTGIVYIHSRDFIHGDITANNVLLVHDCSNVIAKISDFGVSRMVAPNQVSSTQSSCTDCYMPPESLKVPPSSSKKVDSFSVGVLIIHSLIHEPPKPLPATYRKEKDVITRTEYERRQSYLEYLKAESRERKLLPLIKRCLQDEATSRPTAPDILADIQVIFQESHKKYSENSTDSILHCGTTPAVPQPLRQDEHPIIINNYTQETNIYNTITKSNIQESTLNFGHSISSSETSPSSRINSGSCQSSIEAPNIQETKEVPSKIERGSNLSEPLNLQESKTVTVNGNEEYKDCFKFEENADCKVAVVIGSNQANLKQITMETGADVCYNNDTHSFIITGDSKDQTVQGKEKLLELIKAVCERPMRNKLPFVLMLPIPPKVPKGMLCGRQRMNLTILTKSTKCQFEIYNPANQVWVFGRSKKHCEIGAREMKIMISKIANNISAVLIKTLSFLSGVDNDAKVTLVKVHNPEKLGLLPEKVYHALQLVTRSSKYSADLDLSHVLYYNFIRQKVEESFTDLLYADHSPIEVKLLIKFGKVLWDLPVVNSALIHPVKDLDKDGSVNLEKFIFADAQPDPKHNFSPGVAVHILNLNESKLPLLGQDVVITVQVVVLEHPSDKEILDVVNIKCRKSEKRYEVFDVIPKTKKNIVIDAVCLEGNFDFRLKLSFSTKDDLKVVSHESVREKFWDIGDKIASDIVENEDGVLFITPRQADYASVFVARRKRLVYQYDFHGSSYLLTYYESDECVESDLMKLNEPMSQKGPVPLRLRKDRGVMIHDCQMLLDFATLYDPDVHSQEVFSWYGCTRPPANSDLKAKEPTVSSILSGLDKLVKTCLHLSKNKISATL